MAGPSDARAAVSLPLQGRRERRDDDHERGQQEQGGLPAVVDEERLPERREDELAEEPAAVARPIAAELFSSGTRRPSAAMTIVNEPPDNPIPTSTPAVRLKARGVGLTAMSATPRA